MCCGQHCMTTPACHIVVVLVPHKWVLQLQVHFLSALNAQRVRACDELEDALPLNCVPHLHMLHKVRPKSLQLVRVYAIRICSTVRIAVDSSWESLTRLLVQLQVTFHSCLWTATYEHVMHTYPCVIKYVTTTNVHRETCTVP